MTEPSSPPPLSEPTTWRIHLVRELLSEATQRALQNSPIARMRALLDTDHAIDVLLSTLLPLLGVPVAQNWNVPQLLETIAKKRPGLTSHQTPIDRLHRLRNRVHHDGVVPSPEDVRQMCAEGEVFIRGAVREVLLCELEDISLASSIRDPDLRRRMMGAELALREADCAKALTDAAVALGVGQMRHRRFAGRQATWGADLAKDFLDALADSVTRAVGSTTAHQDPTRQFALKIAGGIKSFGPRRALVEMLRPLELARYGVPLDQFARYQSIAPLMIWTAANTEEPRVSTPPMWSPSEDDARFTVDFVRAVLLRLQEREPGTWPTLEEPDTSDQSRG